VSWWSFRETLNPVVVVIGGVDTTLEADEELVTAGTVQVATNAETARGFPAAASATQTRHVIS
jgi:hypothetical protein